MVLQGFGSNISWSASLCILCNQQIVKTYMALGM